MSPRVHYVSASPAAQQAMLGLEAYLKNCSLDHNLLELIKLRCSQINGCSFCCDMHSGLLLEGGEDPRRLATVAAWRECEWFTPRERAALAWAEALTLLPQSNAPDPVYQELAAQFSETEQVELSMAIITINGWNRLAVGFRIPPRK